MLVSLSRWNFGLFVEEAPLENTAEVVAGLVNGLVRKRVVVNAVNERHRHDGSNTKQRSLQKYWKHFSQPKDTSADGPTSNSSSESMKCTWLGSYRREHNGNANSTKRQDYRTHQ